MPAHTDVVTRALSTGPSGPNGVYVVHWSTALFETVIGQSSFDATQPCVLCSSIVMRRGQKRRTGVAETHKNEQIAVTKKCQKFRAPDAVCLQDANSLIHP